jgi:hypothetical protein
MNISVGEKPFDLEIIHVKDGTGFMSDEPVRAKSHLELICEYHLTYGDFIRAEDTGELYYVNNWGYIRPLSTYEALKDMSPTTTISDGVDMKIMDRDQRVHSVFKDMNWFLRFKSICRHYY